MSGFEERKEGRVVAAAIAVYWRLRGSNPVVRPQRLSGKTARDNYLGLPLECSEPIDLAPLQ